MFEPVIAKEPVLEFNDEVNDNILELKLFIELLKFNNDAVWAFNEIIFALLDAVYDKIEALNAFIELV